MADKDIQQPQGWKQRMLQLASGIFAPYIVLLPVSTASVVSVAASARDLGTVAMK